MAPVDIESSNKLTTNDGKLQLCAEEIYSCFNNKKRNEFVTIIIGSGASASPKTDILKNGLISELTEDVFITNARVHFGRKTKEDCTLEESFSIYAKLNNDKSIYKFLKNKDIITRDYNIYPTRGYEFLSYLVNHKLVHNIITTNFDEEIEISLDNEVGRENYRIIKSLSEFDAFNMEIESENEKEKKTERVAKEVPRKPILLKVHGTISYPRTIRASIDNVKKFENEKLKAIKWILCNTKIFIILGFGFRDKDFQHAFSEALKEKAYKENIDDKMRIWWIHRNKSRQEDHRIFLESMMDREAIKRRIAAINLISIKSDDFLRELSERIGRIDDNKTIPTIARHIIRSLIMNYSSTKDVKERKFYIDLILFALTAKGLFGLNALKDSKRVQKYCNECKNSIHPSPRDLLDNLIKFGLIKQVENRNIFFLPERESSEQNYFEDLTKNILKFFDIRKMAHADRDKLKSQLEILDKTFDVDIIEPDASLYLMFKDPQPIRNHKIWEEKTNEFLMDAKNLKIIAQTGEWITNSIIEENLKNIENIKLITCEKFVNAGMHSKRQNFVEMKLLEMFGDKIDIKYLPWEVISKHIKINDKGQGMYMERIEKSSVVAPVWLSNYQDIKHLDEMFDNYWEDAQYPASYT